MRHELIGLGRSSLVYGTGQLLLRAISLLLLPVFTAYLTPADYGVISVLTLATFFLAPVAALGIPSAIGLVYFDDDETGRVRTIASAVAIEAVAGLGLVFACFALREPLLMLLFGGSAGGTATADGLLLVAAVATAAIGNVSQPLLLRLQFERRATSFVAVTAASSLITIGISVTLVAGLGTGVTGMIAGSLGGQLAGLILAAAASIRGASLRPQTRMIDRLLRIGLPLTPSFLFVFVILQLNRYILQVERGLDDVGIYTVGFNLGFTMSIAVSGFTSAWFPFFLSYADRPDEARSVFARVTSYYVIGLGSLALLYFLAARPAVLILTRETFHDAYLSVGAAATAQLLLGLHSIVLAGMYFAKETRPGVAIQGVAAAIGILLNLVLIGPYGVGGAALALVAGCAVMVGLQHVWNGARRYLAVPYESDRLSRFGVLFIAISIASVWPRSASLALELAWSAAGAALTAIVAIWLLRPAERRLAWETASKVAMLLTRSST